TDRLILFCPHCGNTAPQTLSYSHSYDDQAYNMDGTKSDMGPPCEYFVRVCETCNNLLLYHSFLDNPPELSYPKSTELPLSVPKAVRECYSEAARIKNNAPNAYAVMLRRGLETICDDRNIKKGNLYKKLEILAEKGEIPPTLAEITTILRVLGNVGAHSATENVTVPMTWGMDEFFRAIIEYVYIAPSKVKEFKSRTGRNTK
ncbi:hypothetical protein MNBD_GAMMA15-2613, partial [hydrothermal vent metagenome]